MNTSRSCVLVVTLCSILVELIANVSAQNQEDLRISDCVRCCRAFESRKAELFHGLFLLEQCEDDGCRKKRNPNIDCEYTRKGWGEKQRSCNLGKDWYNNYNKGFGRWEKSNGEVISYACILRSMSEGSDDVSLTFAPTREPTASPTKKPSKSPTTPKPTEFPSTSPTTAPTTSKPTGTPTTPQPTSSPTTSKPTRAPTTHRPTTFEEFLESQSSQKNNNILSKAGGGIMIGAVVVGVLSAFTLIFVIRRSRRNSRRRRRKSPKGGQNPGFGHGFFDNSGGSYPAYADVPFSSSPAVMNTSEREVTRGAQFQQRNPAPTSLRVDNVPVQNLWPGAANQVEIFSNQNVWSGNPNPAYHFPARKQSSRKVDSMRPPSAFGSNSGRSRHANINIHDMHLAASRTAYSPSEALFSSGPSSTTTTSDPSTNLWGSVPVREYSDSTESASSMGLHAPPGMMSEKFLNNRHRMLSESEDDEFENVEF